MSDTPKQPVPTVMEQDVERIVRRDFPATEVYAILSMLAEYGRDTYHWEPLRVRIDILKIANGDPSLIRGLVDNAKGEYRDAIFFAEYRRWGDHAFTSESELTPEEEQKLIDADWKEFQDWFTR